MIHLRWNCFPPTSEEQIDMFVSRIDLIDWTVLWGEALDPVLAVTWRGGRLTPHTLAYRLRVRRGAQEWTDSVNVSCECDLRQGGGSRAVRFNRSQTHAMGQDEDLERLMGHLGQYQTLHFSITIPVVVFVILNYCRIVSILYPW